MDNRVPLHALVLVLLRDHASSVAEAYRRFPAHEVMTPQSITADLVGEAARPDLLAISLTEMQRRMTLKLSLGERVVIAAPNLVRPAQRAAFARLARMQGASVVYLLADPVGPILAGDMVAGDVLAGDGIASVVFATQSLRVVQPLPSAAAGGTMLAALSGRFRGLTVVGDVHGDLAGLTNALAWARMRNHFVWFLGDVIDCGPRSLDALVAVYHGVMRGEAGVILGNHERKIGRWLAQQDSGDDHFKLSAGNAVTVAALTALAPAAQRQWSGQFRSVLSRASLINHLGGITLVHAAVHPAVWRQAAPRAGDAAPDAARPPLTRDEQAAEDQAIEDFALYGEHRARSQCQGLSYRWVDAVPAGKTVFAGHAIRSTTAPVVVRGATGGQVVFLDTGAGKGGALSSADLRFVASPEGTGVRLENFNRH